MTRVDETLDMSLLPLHSEIGELYVHESAKHALAGREVKSWEDFSLPDDVMTMAITDGGGERLALLVMHLAEVRKDVGMEKLNRAFLFFLEELMRDEVDHILNTLMGVRFAVSIYALVPGMAVSSLSAAYVDTSSRTRNEAEEKARRILRVLDAHQLPLDGVEPSIN